MARTSRSYCTASKATLSFSLRGEYFREVVFFRDKEDLANFKFDEYTFSAQVTGVALSTGVSTKHDYHSGMAVFIMTDTGFMVDASLGGQKFSFVKTPAH